MSTIIKKYKRNQKLLKKALRACNHLLKTSPNAVGARKYINSRLNNNDQILWGVGYFPTDNNIQELLSLISQKELEEINLYYPKYLAGGIVPHGHFSEHNLVMPFKNVYGDIVAIVGRCLLPEEERQELLLNKYKYSNGCKKDLYVYGLDKAKESIIQNNYVICVEGQFDCIALHTQGITNAVAFGCANMSKYQAYKLHRYTNNIVLMFDNDEAGLKARVRIKNRYKDLINIKTVNPPEGFKDIDDFFNNSKDTDYIKYVIDMIRTFGE
ncbi:MAG: toprim domain-containing protein [Clostridia bacterium]|jgi:DNA primase